MIGQWPELQKLKKQNRLEDARDLLLFELSNYAKFVGLTIIVVFDAQLVPGIQQTYDKYGLTVVFTKEEETADTYIEREAGLCINPLTHVRVATSDLAEQWVIFSKGALRMSARELYKSVKETEEKILKSARNHHNKKIRRNSPWSVSQLEQLQRIFDELES